MSTALNISLALLLAGCSPDAGKHEAIDISGSAETQDEPGYEGPTYYADIKPLMETHCVSCHQDGEIGSFGLDSAEGVGLLSEQVADAVQSRRMPPWKAVDGCDEYRNDISLSQDEIDTIVTWADEGGPEGDPEEPAAGEAPEVEALERVDFSLELPVPYTPSATAQDDYRCFPVPWPVDVDSYVTGFAVNPDQKALVHHVIAYIAPAAYEDALLAEEALDGQPGYTCYGGPVVMEQIDAEWLGAWAPGQSQGNFPNGVGVHMEADDWVVLQVHYNNVSGMTAADQTSVDFQIENEVERNGWIQPFTNPSWVGGEGMDIPAETTGVSYSFDWTMIMSLDAHTANLHMHELGSKASMTLIKADGTEDCLLQIDDWDFNWQRGYAFERKKSLEPGDTWSLSCEWDNPTDQDVAWGDGTGDEMCLGSMLMSLP
jgi:hypothetical protein